MPGSTDANKPSQEELDDLRDVYDNMSMVRTPADLKWIIFLTDSSPVIMNLSNTKKSRYYDHVKEAILKIASQISKQTGITSPSGWDCIQQDGLLTDAGTRCA